MDVVVVESPTKARSIAKYLGPGYRVLPSFGHVRDLPERDGSVRPERDFEMIYELLPDKKKRIAEIARALKGAKRLWLATDPDREGEAISWHLVAALRELGALDGIEVKRVVFHEVTRRAVLEAMARPRELDMRLIDAYQARRALDYLVGFTLSPVLWRKLQGSRSAGRVQSVALRLICEREAEIEAFRPREYWTVEALLENREGARFRARLTHLDGARLDKFALSDQQAAERARAAVEAAELRVLRVERKRVSRNPPPPFTTATLQQEASRKLGFPADRTMRLAQRLFEGVELDGETVGLITYMRTDSVQLAEEAVRAIRDHIRERFGDAFVPAQPPRHKTRARAAQEAHEAIRPTDVARTPEQLARFLDRDLLRLYDLIWRRAVASQMAAARFDRVSAEVGDEARGVVLRASGQTLAFAGHLQLYQEGRDDPGDEEEDGTLPALATGEPVERRKVEAKAHTTEPPPRYTEASLVKRLEELGVGRPSTYAQILSVLQERRYVRLENKRFVPEDRGRLVNAFLVSFFDEYVQPAFTARLEDQLDAIAAGEIDWRAVLRRFWTPFSAAVEQVQERRVSEILEALNEALAPKLFPPREDGGDPRRCPACGDGTLSLKLGRFGAFVGCSRYPACRYTRPLAESREAGARERLIGVDPDSGEEIWLKVGRFGPYVQRGGGEQAQRISLPPGWPPDEVDLARARALLSLPRSLGHDPETGEEILVGINRFGPYLQRGAERMRLPAEEDVLTIGINRALALLADRKSGPRRRMAHVLRELGPHPKDQKPVQLVQGRFGPYVRHGRVNASLPKGTDPEGVDLAQALHLLEAKSKRGGRASGRKRRAVGG